MLNVICIYYLINQIDKVLCCFSVSCDELVISCVCFLVTGFVALLDKSASQNIDPDRFCDLAQHRNAPRSVVM